MNSFSGMDESSSGDTGAFGGKEESNPPQKTLSSPISSHLGDRTAVPT
jgi:hypothetical protein